MWLWFFLITFGFIQAAPPARLELTTAESTWIAAHRSIRLGIYPKRPPIEFRDGKGMHDGISLAIIQHIAQVSGLRFQVVEIQEWDSVLAEIQQGSIDMVSAARPTPTRKEFMAFTQPYMHIPMVIVTNENVGYIDDLSALAGKTIGNVTGYASSEYLLAIPVSLNAVSFESYTDALDQLALGNLDAVVGNLAALSNEMHLRKYPLRLSAPLSLESELSMGVRKDWPELVSILNKALATVSEKERDAIKDQWIYANDAVDTSWNSVVKGIATGTIFLLCIIVIFILWNRRLHQEISERRNAERIALENERKYRMLFEHMQQGFALHEIITDADNRPIDYRYLEANPAFQQLTGADPAVIVGKTVSEIMPDTEEYWIQTFGQVALTGEPLHFEQYSQTFERWLSTWTFSPAPRQFAVVFSDVTEQHFQRERMQAQNESMIHFIYTVSHDLKSPLLTVTNFAMELASDLEQGDTQAVLEDLKYISSAANRMQKIVDELQLVAQAGSKKLQYTTMLLGEIAQEVYGAVAGRYTSQGIQFVVHNKDHVLRGDKDRIFQLLQNLLDNAAKYIGTPNAPKVEIGVEKHGAENAIYVRDNGVGIAPEDLTKVFGIFEKLNRASDGSGIGLALAKGIVEAHQGRIWATSPGPGQGTTFHFTLNLDKGSKDIQP